MSKADHMLSILWMLKSGKRVTAKQLADKLEINVRTVYRYIDALCASGVPIISDSGHHGGYSLSGPFADSPLVFDLEEQKSLIHAAQFAQEAGYPFGEQLERAIAKLKLYTNQEQQHAIRRHELGFDVISPQADASEVSMLRDLQGAAADSRSLVLDYQKGYGSTIQSRELNPYGLVNWKNKWYVVGHCRLRGEIRSFRVDRIRSMSLTGERFERPADFSARQFFLSNLLPPSDRPEELMQVIIQGKEQAIDDLCGHWYLGAAIVKRTRTEAYFMIETRAMDGHLPYLLLSYGGTIRVMEPESLKKALVEVTGSLLDFYRAHYLD